MRGSVNNLLVWLLACLACGQARAYEPVSRLYMGAEACSAMPGLRETGSLPVAAGLLDPQPVLLSVQADPLALRGRLAASALDSEGTGSRELWHASGLPALPAERLQLWMDRPLAASELAETDPARQPLDWLRGESVAGLPALNLPGMLVGSSLLLVHPQLSASLPGESDDAHWQRLRAGMPALVLAGDGHGLLWALSAREQAGLSAGAAWQAFLPASQPALLAERLQAISDGRPTPGIEGELRQFDLPLAGIWHVLVVGSAGAGGKGIFVLRLFDASRGARPALLWEANPQRAGWESVGHIQGAAQIARHGSRALLLSGNGFGSRDGQAVLMVADAASGELIRQLPVGLAGDNGLAAPQLLLDAEGQLQAAWAGDLHGNLWRFELAGDPSRWRVAFDGQPLFAAGREQPITEAVQVLPHPHGGHMLLFGTGRWLEAADYQDASPQAIFGVWDKPDAGPLQRSQLQQQALSEQQGVRRIDQQLPDWSSQRGWQLSLPVVGGRAEKLVQAPQLQGHRLLLQTRLISADGCTGQDWVWLLNGWSGGMLPAGLQAEGEPLAALVQPAAAPAYRQLLPVAAPVPGISATSTGRLPPCQPATRLLLRAAGRQQLLEIPESCRWQRLQWRQLL